MPLNDIKIRSLKPGDKISRHADGEGLYLELTPKARGSGRWPIDTMANKRRFSFGKYPVVTLAKAREKRAEAKALLADGIDSKRKEKRRALPPK